MKPTPVEVEGDRVEVVMVVVAEAVVALVEVVVEINVLDPTVA
jgi:hypothetical protein